MVSAWNYFSGSPEKTYMLGKVMGTLVQPGDLVCLNGELGVGKTVFAKGFAAGLGITERVASPTYTLINEHHGRMPLYHMDVYRLNDADEMYDLGYEEYFYGQGVSLVEWAETVKEVLPDERLDIIITQTDDNSRMLDFFPLGERYLRLVKELKKNVPAGN